jgi:hypothetical protein
VCPTESCYSCLSPRPRGALCVAALGLSSLRAYCTHHQQVIETRGKSTPRKRKKEKESCAGAGLALTRDDLPALSRDEPAVGLGRTVRRQPSWAFGGGARRQANVLLSTSPDRNASKIPYETFSVVNHLTPLASLGHLLLFAGISSRLK